MTDDERLDYLAGFFDAEGCVSIRKFKGRHQLRFIVANRSPEPLYLYQSAYGGNLRQRKPQKEQWDGLWVWEKGCARNSEFVEAMIGRVTTKLDAFRLAKRFMLTIKSTGGRNKKNKTLEDIARCMLTPSDIAERDQIRVDLAGHNTGRNDKDNVVITHRTSAYLAGLFDGDGAAGVVKPRANRAYVPTAGIYSSYSPLLRYLVLQFGGYIRERQGSRASEWKIYNRGTLKFLEHIKPHLIVKEKVVDKIFSLREAQGRGEKHVVKRGNSHALMFKDSAIEEMDYIASKIRLLNLRGPGYSARIAAV